MTVYFSTSSQKYFDSKTQELQTRWRAIYFVIVLVVDKHWFHKNGMTGKDDEFSTEKDENNSEFIILQQMIFFFKYFNSVLKFFSIPNADGCFRFQEAEHALKILANK